MKKFLLVLLVFTSVDAYANACEVLSGEVTLEGTASSFGGAYPQWLDNCSGTLVIDSPTAEICLFNQLKQWHCKVEKQGNIDVKKLAVDTNFAQDFFAALRSLFDPDVDTDFGGMRLKADDPLPGFPYSEILLPEESLQLNLAPLAEYDVVRFELVERDTNRPVYASDALGTVVTVPAELLESGTRYRWLLESGTGQHYGNFSLASADDQAAFNLSFSEAQSEEELAGTARYLLHAVMAGEDGYNFNQQHSLFQARLSLAIIE